MSSVTTPRRYSDNFAYEPTTHLERVSALGLAAALVGSSACVVGIAQVRLPAMPSFVLLVESFAIVSLLLTGSMLFAQYRARGYAPVGILSFAFASYGLMHAVYIAAFPGVFAPDGLLGASPQTSAWTYLLGRCIFGALLTAFVVAEWRERKGRSLSREVVSRFAKGTGAATALAILGVTFGGPWLPTLVDGGGAFAASYVRLLQPAALLWPLAVAVALIAVSGLRTRVSVWLAVTLLANFLEVAILGVFSHGRYTVGWYWSRVDLAASSILFIVAMQLQLAGVLQRAARAGERSRTLFEVVSSEPDAGRAAIDKLLRAVRADLDFEWAFFARLDDGRASIESSDGETPYADDPRVRLETTLLHAVTGRDLFVLEDETTETGRESRALWAAFVSVPVFVDGRLYGSAGFASRRRRRGPIDDSDRDFLYMFGLLLGSTLERDIRARHLAGLAFFDTLTGLPNRAHFMSRLREELALGERYGSRFAVHFLDLDRFKSINDRFGHAVGDEVLHAFADRLRIVVREGDAVARLGGDEFVILQHIDKGLDEAERLASRIASSCDRNLPTSAGLLDVGVSVGTAIFPSDGSDAATLLAKADEAQYRVKRSQSGARGSTDSGNSVVPMIKRRA
jgi:diguanylate cyclase (GGDEF)-like protein